MRHAVTAIYRSYDVACLVRDELERLGSSRRTVTILPDEDRRTAPTMVGTTPGTTAADGYVGARPGYDDGVAPSTYTAGGHDDAVAGLHRLDLPEDDIRTYQQAIRNGDYVVSVGVDDDADVTRIQEIMRRPEDAYDLDEAKRRHSHVVTDDTRTRTVAALFDSEAEAGGAVNRLRAAGVPDRCILVNPTATEQRDLQAYGDRHKRFHESIRSLSLPEEDTQTFVEAMTRGAYLVTVHDFDSSMHDSIVDILDHESAVDMVARETEWRSSGWAGYQGSRETTDLDAHGTVRGDGMQDGSLQMAADQGGRSQADLGSQQQGYASSGSMSQIGGAGAAGYDREELNEDGTVKVVEERLNVDKREVEQGSVRVRSYVREEPVSAEVDLRATRVHVERRPVDRAVNPGDLKMRDQVLEAHEQSEQAVVGKQARVVEEIGLRSETEVEHQTVRDTVRKTEVEIEDSRTGGTSRLTGDGTDRDRF